MTKVFVPSNIPDYKLIEELKKTTSQLQAPSIRQEIITASTGMYGALFGTSGLYLHFVTPGKKLYVSSFMFGAATFAINWEVRDGGQNGKLLFAGATQLQYTDYIQFATPIEVTQNLWVGNNTTQEAIVSFVGWEQ